ncbi:MAG: NAD-dependent deacylase [Anaerolineaceae bacterium]|nr:MAG: NAD-dependent deacylase [Anaerolineaceae bacterium]
MTTQAKIDAAARLINGAKKIAVLTGAGVSKESGVPTFRDALEGLWARYDPQELATPQAFQRNPKLVWDWYEFRRKMVRKAKPNPGHVALTEIQKRKPDTWIITQNVDDLHEQAGSQNVIHLHGNIASTKCSADCCGKPTLIDLDALPDTLKWDAEKQPPPCPYCGAYARPDVVWFGEVLPADALSHAHDLSVACDVMIVVGTSGLVTPAANLPHYAKRAGAMVVEVNPDHSMISPIADLRLEAPSGQALPRVVERLN